jgi:hypothetical protein
MAYTPTPLFAGDLHDNATRLAAQLAQHTRGFPTVAPPPEGSEGWRQMLALGWQGESGANAKLVWARRLGENPNPTAVGLDQDGTLIRNRFWINASLPF